MTFAVAATTTAFADSDPSVDQIYKAAAGGHLDQAQTMISQVLADHPTSGRAHYVQAELYAREGKTSLARSELETAEQLKPGLPFASPRAVQDLKAQLGLRSGAAAPVLVRGAPAERSFPWGTVLILAAVVGVLWLVFRRRTPYGQYPVAGPGGGPGYGPGAPGGYGPAGYGPGYGPAPMGGGGIGSGIAGGLASGLAVGAGVVAGEELAHHFLDGGRGGGVIPPAEAGESVSNNGDMGGSDFGVNDPGSGWDDGGGGGGSDGGGGDWS
jgi:hypothetical protein